MAEGGVRGAGAPRKLLTSQLMMVMLVIQSHLGFGVVVAASRRQRYYNYYNNNEDNDNGSRWTTSTSSVASTAPSYFVFKDCGEH